MWTFCLKRFFPRFLELVEKNQHLIVHEKYKYEQCKHPTFLKEFPDTELICKQVLSRANHGAWWFTIKNIFENSWWFRIYWVFDFFCHLPSWAICLLIAFVVLAYFWGVRIYHHRKLSLPRVSPI